jgi:hypothetical protein
MTVPVAAYLFGVGGALALASLTITYGRLWRRSRKGDLEGGVQGRGHDGLARAGNKATNDL